MFKSIKTALNRRLGRKNYILGLLSLVLPLAVLSSLTPTLIRNASLAQAVAVYLAMPFILYLATRRIHDMGFSSKPFLFYVLFRELLPISAYILGFPYDREFWYMIFMGLNLLAGLCLLILEGSKGINAYGAPTDGLRPLEALLPPRKSRSLNASDQKE